MVVVTLLGQLGAKTRRLELGDQHLVVAMRQQTQGLGVGGALAQVDVADMEREYLVLGQQPELGTQVEAFADQVVEALVDQVAGRDAEPTLDVLAGLEYAQVLFVQHQQEALGLDAARDLDRFLGTAFHGRGQGVVCSH